MITRFVMCVALLACPAFGQDIEQVLNSPKTAQAVAPTENARAPFAGEGESIAGFRCQVTGQVFSCRITQEKARALDRSTQPRISQAVEFCEVMTPHFLIRDKEGEFVEDPRRLHFVGRFFRSIDKLWFIEAAVMNDSMHHPNGCISGDWALVLGGNLAGRWNGGIMVDQTGWIVRLGTPFLAVDRQKLSKIAMRWPDVEMTDNALRWDSLIDVRGEDHNALNTHQTGSPFNMYHAYDAMWTYYFHVRQRHSRADGVAGPMIQFAHEKIGTTRFGIHHTERGVHRDSDMEEHRWRYETGRPGLLTDYSSGFPVPYRGDRRYETEGGDRFYGHMYEGVVQLKWGRSWQVGARIATFGREDLPVVDAGPFKGRRDEWPTAFHGARTNGWRYTGEPTIYGLEGHNWTDPEHDAADRLAAACICTPSEFARHALWTTVFNAVELGPDGNPSSPGINWSYRTMGWRGKTLAYGWLVFRLEVCRELAREWRDKFLSPRWIDYAGGAVNFRDKDDPNKYWVKGWQLATWARTCAMWADLEEDPDQKALWIEALSRASMPLRRCYVDGQGYAEWYAWTGRDPTSANHKSPGISEGQRGDVTVIGTRHWIPEARALMKLLDHTRRENYADAEFAWARLKARRNYPLYLIINRNAAKWHPACMVAFGMEGMGVW